LPNLSYAFVRRDRIESLLSASTERQVTRVSAPPGAGKTTALAGWARGCERPVTWITLDTSDNQPRQLWAELTAALDWDGSNARRRGLPESAGRQARHDTVPERLPGVRPRKVIILDDVHVITDNAVLSELDRFIQWLPPETSLVLAGRHSPDLHLQRLRANGSVSEISAAELRFSCAEAEPVIAGLAGGPVPCEAVSRLVTRTEGWAAGLALAALELREGADHGEVMWRLTESTDWIAGYFEEEVLAGLSDEQMRLLELVAVANPLDDAVVSTVTGVAAAEEQLAGLAGANLFVQHDGHTWREHQLLAGVLRRRLATGDPDSFVATNHRAGEVFERRGEVGRALHHYEAAGECARASSLCASAAVDRLASGRIGPDEPLPEVLVEADGIDDQIRQACAQVLAHLAAGELWQAKLRLERLESLAARENDATVLREIELFEAMLARLAAEPDAMIAHGQRVLAGTTAPAGSGRLSSGPAWFERLDRLAAPMAAGLVARGYLWLGRYDAAESALAKGAADGCSPLAVLLAGLRARALAGAGQLREAHQLADAAIETACCEQFENGLSVFDAHVARARVYYERGHPAAALLEIDRAAALVRACGNTAQMALVELYRVPPLLAADRNDEAFALISRLREADLATPLPQAVRVRLELSELEWRLNIGDVELAAAGWRRLALQVRSPLLEARIELAAGRPQKAIARLDACSSAESSLLAKVERLVLIARASLHTGLTGRARDSMHRAVELARPESLARPFLHHGVELRWLLSAQRSRYPDPYLDDLIAALPQDSHGGEPSAGEPSALLEGLTERERAALVRLPSYLTQPEIAAELFMSVNTLKTHLKGLYRKLGACSRAEAVASARRHGLV
jgi:LuxR family maltose regulon positive regulatory protein